MKDLEVDRNVETADSIREAMIFDDGKTLLDHPVKIVVSEFFQLCATMDLNYRIFLIQVFLAGIVVFIHLLQ
jgi:hypothetical protein